MIKALLSAITGIPENFDDDEYQEAWQHQRVIDELDIDSSDNYDDPEDEDEPRPWWQVW